MSTFLFMNIPTTGHVNPSLPVAAELVRRGHKVVYYLTEAYRERIEATGADYHAYPGIDQDYLDAVSRRFNPVQLAAQLVGTAIQLNPTLLEAVSRVQPHAIVYDSMCPWGRMTARQANLPAVASMALLDLPLRYLLRSGELPSFMWVMARALPWIPRYLRRARALQKATGVAVPSFIKLLNWPGDRSICYTVRILLPEAQECEGCSFVGPPLQAASENIPFPFQKLAPDRPLVYVSLGTVFNNSPHFFRTCLAAFAGSEVQVVVSTGRRLQAGDLAPIPENALICDYVPQQAILQRASLFVSHSGANSVQQALYNGVPLLLVPQQLEQALIAARLSELGAGLLLNRRRLTPEAVRQMGHRLLTDSAFRYRSAALGAELKKAGGAARAASVIEETAAVRPPAS